MPRIRCIKPDFWSDEKLARVSREARLVFIGLWGCCDDYGVTRGDHVYLKSQLFAYDLDLTVDQFSIWMSELQNMGFIVKMVHHDNTYYHLPNFLKHQRIDHPSKTRNPDPSEMLATHSRKSREGSRKAREGSRNRRDEYNREGEGEGKGEREEEGEMEVGKGKGKEAAKPLSVFDEILLDLRKKSGRKFKPTESTKKLIQERLDEGFTVADFWIVHTNKVSCWKGDPKMEPYLRPTTLYQAGKFQGYLNDKPKELVSSYFTKDMLERREADVIAQTEKARDQITRKKGG